MIIKHSYVYHCKLDTVIVVTGLCLYNGQLAYNSHMVPLNTSLQQRDTIG